MSLARRLIVLIAGVAGAYAYLGNRIPQIRSGPVAKLTRLGSSPAELVASGRHIFTGDRAGCLTCHSIGEDPRARCPDMEGVGARAAHRRPGRSAAEYLVESVYNPSAYVVEGYPAHQMNPVNRPPIALSHAEIRAVIAFLNSLGGRTDEAFLRRVQAAQAPWRDGRLQPDANARPTARLPVLPGDARRGRRVLEKHKCLQCHRVGREGRDVCPELTAIGAVQSGAYILESILNPSAVIVKGYKQVIVIWKDEDRMAVRGPVVAWRPDPDHPKTVTLYVEEDGERRERVIDLKEAAYVGDTTVGVQQGDAFTVLCGKYIEGDEKQGVTLAVLENGRWVPRRIEADAIDFVNAPLSPMPANFAERMTPREIFDLVAYLLAQKGKP